MTGTSLSVAFHLTHNCAALAALGIAASCSQQPHAVGSRPSATGDPPAAVSQHSDAAVANPFTLEKSGLPHVSSAFGNGAPSYLEDEVARAVIERVFREAGFRLKPRQPFDRHGVTFIADGYDANRHVGYVFATAGNLDDDALEWPREPGERQFIDYWLCEMARSAERRGKEARAEEIRSIQRLPDPAKREAAYRAMVGQDHPTKLSLAEARRLISSVPRQGEFIAVISGYDDRLILGRWSKPLLAALEQATLLPDPAERNAAVIAVHEKAAREVVDRLEQDVRDYISWARSQGLQ